MDSKSFTCINCGREVFTTNLIGSKNRNHCPFCLYSRHVDAQKPGDRKSACRGPMKPVGLTFKHEGVNKYTAKPRQGEIMLIHICQLCGSTSLNRIAADDETDAILKVFEDSLSLNKELQQKITSENIKLLEEKDLPEIKTQLFGKTIA